MSSTLLLLLAVPVGAVALASLAAAERRARLAGRLSRRARAAGIAAAVAFICVATLIPSSGEEGSKLRLDPTDGLDQLQGLGNVVLFVPLGGFLSLLGLSARRTALAGVLLSVAVEAVQFFLVEGRYASTGDVLLNGVGAVLGHLAVATRSRTREDAGITS